MPGSSTIDVRLREASQLFNSMDPSPFNERELDDDAEKYIVDSLKELRSRVPTAIMIYLDQAPGRPEEESYITTALRVHFDRRSKLLRQDVRQLLRRGLVSLSIGLAFLISLFAVSQLVERLLGDSASASILRQSLLIAGWVAMWRPLEIFLYDWWPILGDVRIYKRLSETSVRIIYRDPAPIQTRSQTH